MRAIYAKLSTPSLRPYVLLIAIAVVLALVDGGRGRFLNHETVFSMLQFFATIGPVALGLGLTMIIGEFDISVGGMLSLAGCIAVMTGAGHPVLGVLAAVAAGFVSGLAQGTIMVRLNLSSVGVTLGGLLTLGGLSYVLTGNQTLGYAHMDVAMLVNHPVLEVFSLRSGVAIAAFIVAAAVMGRTRIGRDVIAVGSNRRAAVVAGLNVNRIIVGVFALSGLLTALSGSLLELQLGGGLAGRARRYAGAGGRCGDHRRGIALRRQGDADRNCRRRAGAGRATLRPDRHRRSALHARHRHRMRAAGGRLVRRSGAGAPHLRIPT